MIFGTGKKALAHLFVLISAVCLNIAIFGEYANGRDPEVDTTAPTVKAPAVGSASQPATSGYGPIFERKLVGTSNGLSQIHLATGVVSSGPGDGAYPPTMKGFREWRKNAGMDLAGAVGDRMLLGFDMAVVQADNEKWDMLPADLKDALIGAKVDEPAQIKVGPAGSTTWLFRTREGNVGVLQVTGMSADGQAILFRYKLIKEVAATRP